jgi:hypothetical protein
LFQELDDLAAAADTTDPVRAPELRQLKMRRRDPWLPSMNATGSTRCSDDWLTVRTDPQRAMPPARTRGAEAMPEQTFEPPSAGPH